MDRNFNLRKELLGEDVIGKENVKMVEIARSHNLACKFSGSGGAIICIPRNNASSFETIQQEFTSKNISFCILKPAPANYPFLFEKD